MEREYIVDQTITAEDFTPLTFKKAEYEGCRFLHCDFSNMDLSTIIFSDCEFVGCNLSMIKTDKTGFRDILFKDCKLVGIPFNHADPFLLSMKYENCVLDLSSFYKLKLKKTSFVKCSLREADFSEADFTQAVFNECDLLHAIFAGTIVEKADFRTSFNYSIDPETNRIRKAKFSMPAAIGLLDKFDIDISL